MKNRKLVIPLIWIVFLISLVDWKKNGKKDKVEHLEVTENGTDLTSVSAVFFRYSYDTLYSTSIT